MLDAPSVSSRHLSEMGAKFPHAFYTWNRSRERFELWCDERRGTPPYMFMVIAGPGGEYRDPGDWVMRHLRATDPDTGEYQTGTKAGRQKWIQSLEDQSYVNKLDKDRRDREVYEMRNSARFINNHGRVHSLRGVQPSSYHMKRKLGG